MCGRFGISTDAHTLAAQIGAAMQWSPSADYNIAPGRAIWVFRQHGRDAPVPAQMRWGFIPSWDQRGKATINARCEKMRGRFWRRAFARRRCVIPAQWWYEWQSEAGHKQPHAIRPASAQPFFFAGVWARARSLAEDHPAANRDGCAIVTRPAVAGLASIHHRMPLVLDVEEAGRWLSSGISPGDVSAMAEVPATQAYESWPISSRINSAAAAAAGDITLLDALADDAVRGCSD